MTQIINEDIRRLQKLSGILLEDNAFDQGRPDSGNHDDAYWAAKEKSGREVQGMSGDVLHDEDGNPVDVENSLLVWGDESQDTVIAITGVTSTEQLDASLRQLVGDRVYSAYIDEPGVFEPTTAAEVGHNVFCEIMSVKEVARLLNRWAVRNGMGEHVKRIDKTNMRASAPIPQA